MSLPAYVIYIKLCIVSFLTPTSVLVFIIVIYQMKSFVQKCRAKRVIFT